MEYACGHPFGGVCPRRSILGTFSRQKLSAAMMFAIFTGRFVRNGKAVHPGYLDVTQRNDFIRVTQKSDPKVNICFSFEGTVGKNG
jgi:hypothetical protein